MMNILEAIKSRKSIRDFKSTQIPRGILREILETACRAPSAMNTQPWEFTVITKEVLDAVIKSVFEKFRAGEKPHSKYSVTAWPMDSVYRQRQVELAKLIFHLLGIKREDTAKRQQWMEQGLRFFNAPVVIIICIDRMLISGTSVFDIGAVTQNICLTALHYGLGTCIQDQGVMYPEVLRKYCNIPDSKEIIITISVGYPNWDFPANQIATTREPIDMLTSWCGFIAKEE
jgi:nitroreductase